MSREADLYKDKIEVSLDGRQIFYLFFGGSVIVGLVFVLGVMVGRRVEARGHVEKARVSAQVDPLAALDRLEGGTGLSFQGSLRGGDAPINDVEKQIAAMQKDAAAADKKDSKKTDAKKAEPEVKPEPKAEVKPEPKAETKSETKAEPKAETKSEPKTETKADEAKKTEKKADEAKKAEAKQADDAKAAKTDKADDAKAEAPKEDKKRYTLQLSSFQDKQEAETYLASIKSAGYQAYITEGAVDGKQYYRVRTGNYKSMDAANEAKAELEKSTHKSAIVTRL